MNVYFLAKQLGSNYLDEKTSYSRLCNGNFHHIVYGYWILKNKLREHNINLFLVGQLPEKMERKDIVIFHYDTQNLINHAQYTTVQDIGDFPVVQGTKYFITHNTAMADNKHFYVGFPLPANIRKFNPVFPPSNFTCVGSKHSINKEIMTNKYIEGCRDYGINLKFITDKNYVNIDTDVFVFLRDKNLSKLTKDNGEPLHPSSIWSPITGRTHRHANRIYQAWYMNTPCIHNRESPIENLVRSSYDILYAETPREFFQKMVFLRNNEEFFNKMIDNCKRRSEENSYETIVKQYVDMFKQIEIENL
jgi:glycosyltransferase involved in cell wall biosynthesis